MTQMVMEAIRKFKANNTSETQIGTYRFKLECSPYREKEYKILFFDRSNPNLLHVEREFVSWEEFDAVEPA